MKTKFKGFINLSVEVINTVFGWNSPIVRNGETAIAIDTKEVIIKCACNNCGDIRTVRLTKLQIKKINTILNTK